MPGHIEVPSNKVQSGRTDPAPKSELKLAEAGNTNHADRVMGALGIAVVILIMGLSFYYVARYLF